MDHFTRVLELLTTHGPATAYAYMKQNDLTSFPSDLVQCIEEGILAMYERQREQKVNMLRDE